MDTLSNEALTTWLSYHTSSIDAGLRVGEIDRKKAQAFRIELIRRECGRA